MSSYSSQSVFYSRIWNDSNQSILDQFVETSILEVLLGGAKVLANFVDHKTNCSRHAIDSLREN